MQLQLDDRVEGEVTVLAVAGEVDVYTAPKLREKVIELVNDGRTRIVVDATEVDFLDSTGLGVLVGALKRVRSANGDLNVVCTTERIRKIFEITGLGTIFGLHTTVDEAIAAL